MNRIVKQDYDKLIEYLESYSLASMINTPAYLEKIKQIHRKLYSYLLFIRESANMHYFADPTVLDYYIESGSDLILSLFCWANGAYKPSEFQLRSAIENFIKASLYPERNDVVRCKNVYEIMDYASSSTIFNSDICQKKLDKLRNTYANLCAFVHSSPDKLGSHLSLIQLTYNEYDATEFCTHFQTVLNSLLSMLYYCYYDFVFSIHSTNRELFFHGLTRTDKAAIYADKTKDI